MKDCILHIKYKMQANIYYINYFLTAVPLLEFLSKSNVG